MPGSCCLKSSVGLGMVCPLSAEDNDSCTTVCHVGLTACHASLTVCLSQQTSSSGYDYDENAARGLRIPLTPSVSHSFACMNTFYNSDQLHGPSAAEMQLTRPTALYGFLQRHSSQCSILVYCHCDTIALHTRCGY